MTDRIMVKELAEKIGMEKDALLLHIREIGIDVEDEDSFLEGEKLAKVKMKVEGSKDEKNIIIEKRVKPTIIRRRAVRQVSEVKVTREKEEEPPQKEQEKLSPVEEKIGEAYKVPKTEVTEQAKTLSAQEAEKKVSLVKTGVAQPPKKVVKKKEKPKRRVLREVEILPTERFVKRKVAEKKWPRARRGRYQKEGRFLKVHPKVIKRPPEKPEITIPKAIKRIVKMSEAISVGDLAKRMGIKSNEVIKKLMELDVIITINQFIDFDAALLVAHDYGFEVENVTIHEMDLIEDKEDTAENLCQKPPVVTVMGHVDHGKTSLLDAIRKTNVTENEAGGITQHIGAYHVHLDKGDITFIDTPGHEAFTAMRARGSKITDIVVLVVAADDGVMPQTVEAINHAKAANVPIIVAINKIDLADADPTKIKQALTEYGLVSEEWGGDTIFAEVSAKKSTGIKDLLEFILLQAEILELKANPNKAASGVVIESKLDKGRGPVATVLVKAGTLKVGNPFVAGAYCGKIRAMISDWGERIEKASPSMPVEVLGLPGVPEAGDPFMVVKDDVTAKQIAEIRFRKQREGELANTSKVSLLDLYEKIKKGDVKELDLIIKGDTHGSVEGAVDSINKLSTEAVRVDVVHSGVGGISESDVMLATASNTVIIGFNVRAETKAQELAEKEGVDIRFYSIIYDLTNDVKKAMEGLLAPTLVEEILGSIEVRQVFNVPKGTIAGCYVNKGKVVRGSRVRLLRDSIVIHDGKLSSLRRFKDDVKEVSSGYECGIGIENFNDIKVGDTIEAYTVQEVATKL